MESSRIQEEFSDYLKLGFIPVGTEDGSFSLRQGEGAEPMHSLGGAFSESMYIYGEAIDLFLEADEKNSSGYEIISVGLGLGYNELLTALKDPKESVIISYELYKGLEELFLKRLNEPKLYPLYWAPFKDNHWSDEDIIRVSMNLKKRLKFEGPFSGGTLKEWSFKKRLVLFDAYSSKTSADLWGEEFLNNLLSRCARGSVFSTYAATGALKRALRSNNFMNSNKSGFKGKRQSTLAIRQD